MHHRKKHGSLTSILLALIAEYGDEMRDYRLVAMVVKACAFHAEEWSHRADDAKRIPAILHEAAEVIRAAYAERLKEPPDEE